MFTSLRKIIFFFRFKKLAFNILLLKYERRNERFENKISALCDKIKMQIPHLRNEIRLAKINIL